MIYRVKVSKESYAFRVNIPKRLVKGFKWERVKVVNVYAAAGNIIKIGRVGNEKKPRNKIV